MAEAYRQVRVEEEEGYSRLILDNPPLNILTIANMLELSEALREAALRPGLKAVSLEGGGERGFSVGVAIEEHLPEVAPEMIAALHGLFRLLWDYPVPTLALVRGMALGGGCELALICDFVLASRDSGFGIPEIKVGTFPPLATVLFPALAGLRKSLELVLQGEIIGAEEAHRLGLITAVVPVEELESKRDELLSALIQKSAPVLRLARRSILDGAIPDFHGSLERAEELYLRDLMATADALEGVRAFMERRRPHWRDA
ncbi:MAG: enoyl-CoA hydratase/isomerase family protein [Nitrospinota bacterium]